MWSFIKKTCIYGTILVVVIHVLFAIYELIESPWIGHVFSILTMLTLYLVLYHAGKSIKDDQLKVKYNTYIKVFVITITFILLLERVFNAGRLDPWFSIVSAIIIFAMLFVILFKVIRCIRTLSHDKSNCHTGGEKYD